MSAEVRSLTGLRGVAAVYVVIYHLFQGASGHGPIGTVLQHGYLAVDLFFILSGFVLAMVHGRDRFDAAGYRRFLRKRFARVYPLYAVVTATTVVMAAIAGHAAFSPGRLLLNAALMQAWGVGASIVPPAWSLSTEVAAYLLFPLLCASLLEGSRAQAAMLGGAAVLLLAVIAACSPVAREGPLDFYQSNTVAPLVRCLCEFALGVVAFRASLSPAPWRLSGWSLAGVAASLMLALLCVRQSDLAVVVLMPLLVAALVAQQDCIVGRLLAASPIHWLGTVSFSIYLTHFLIKDEMREPVADWLARQGWPQPAVWANTLTLGAVLAVAPLAFHAIEKPVRALVRARWAAVPATLDSAA